MPAAPYILAGVPVDRPSLHAAYEAWLQARNPQPIDLDFGSSAISSNRYLVAPQWTVPHPVRLMSARTVGSRRPTRVAIIGGGMAGLYSALLLQSQGVDVHIFEAHRSRVGGRVYTHRFASDKNQYFEAGAMRLPNIPEHQAVFDLIDFLNARVGAQSRIETIPYVLYDPSGNRVFVNGRLQRDGQVMTLAYANAHPGELGFPLTGRNQDKTADALLSDALRPFLEALDEDFAKGWRRIIRYQHLSLRDYLSRTARWSEDKINYVEVMTSQTNQFQHSLTEIVMESRDFSTATWQTIEDGMDRLPLACAEVIGPQNITMGARVYRLVEREDGKIAVYHTGAKGPQEFDKLIAAVPPSVLRMLDRPRWSVQKEQSIRALHFEPLYKIGLRFKTRFWEKGARATRGGQSITDLPSRWIVYPSYGIDDDGPGVLLLYSWMTDATCWLPQSREDRQRIALRDLASVYRNEVDVNTEFIEAFDVPWSLEWATGDAMFLPGQFQLWDVARQPERSIYFAGEHLSTHHTWIVGALDSALLACQQLLGDPSLDALRPKDVRRQPHFRDYSDCAAA